MDIEAFSIAVGMDSALNLGSGSCVSSDGCHGVTQDHLERFAALVQAAERERGAEEVQRLRAALGRIEQAQALGTAHAVAGLALRGIVDDGPATSAVRAGCGFPYCGGDSPECATCGKKA